MAFLFLVALFLGQGLYYSRMLVPAHDGVQYLLLGAKALRGEVGIFDDRLPGNRLPLPFYVLGATQIAGPDLLAARWLNVVFGLLALGLTAALARRLAGEAAGLLAAAFLATQGVVVAYYSYESYPAFAAFCVMASLFVLMGGDSPGRRILGMALVGLLFFVRSNLWPAIPLLLAWALWRARSRAERVLLVAVVAVPPLLFIAWDPTHLKVLAYVPVLRRLVAPLGYVSVFVIDDRETLPMAGQLWGVVRVLRRYEFWALATAVLALVSAWRIWSGRPVGWLVGKTGVLGAVFAGSLGALFLMYSWNFRWVGLYFLPYAPVLALLLGVGYAALLAEVRERRWPRRLLLVALAILLASPLYYVRNPLLPIGAERARDPFLAAHTAAARLRAHVPDDAHVFFYGLNALYYLSGLPHTDLRQVYTQNQFARIDVPDWVLKRTGFVTAGEMRSWLTAEADYAVIDSAFLNGEMPHFGTTEKEMVVLLDRHFEVVATLADGPYNAHIVYRRRSR